MNFRPTLISGVYIVDLAPERDDRGLFVRTFCAQTFARAGLDPRIVQCSDSFSTHRGTLRGMHFQAPPYAEAKLIRCTFGAVFDVVVDLRPHSTSFKRWVGMELCADSLTALYVPEGVAHGFLTLTDRAALSYQMSVEYHPPSAAGVRWNDPAFAIDWPGEVRFVSARDASFADFSG